MISYAVLPETDFILSLPDGKQIHGLLRGVLSPTTPVVVMMHGRPGSANELLQYLGARYLSEVSFTTLRLCMYDTNPRYRDLVDCTLETHIADFEVVVAALRAQGVQQLFAIGHSYGGLTILGSQAVLDGAVLWDPTHGLAWHDPAFALPEGTEIVYDDLLIGRQGQGYVATVRQETYDQALGDTTAWAVGKPYPQLFVLAGAGPLAPYGRRYYEAADGPKDCVELSEAHHAFDDSDAVVERLLQETARFLRAQVQA